MSSISRQQPRPEQSERNEGPTVDPQAQFLMNWVMNQHALKANWPSAIQQPTPGWQGQGQGILIFAPMPQYTTTMPEGQTNTHTSLTGYGHQVR